MALFTRRHLQRILDENARFLKSGQLRNSIKQLNSVCDEYLAKEWELALLNAASKHGHVEHEPGASDERKPDLRFRSNDDGVAFIADVATISDHGFHQENPVDAFRNVLFVVQVPVEWWYPQLFRGIHGVDHTLVCQVIHNLRHAIGGPLEQLRADGLLVRGVRRALDERVSKLLLQFRIITGPCGLPSRSESVLRRSPLEDLPSAGICRRPTGVRRP